MRSGAHMAGGALAGLAVSSVLYGAGALLTVKGADGRIAFSAAESGLSYAVVSGAVIGSLFPDIDRENTKASNKAPLLSAVIRIFTQHRGFLHSFAGAAVAYYILLIGGLLLLPYLGGLGDGGTFALTVSAFYSRYCVLTERLFGCGPYAALRPFAYGFAAGEVSHSMYDMLTPKGAPLLWPLLPDCIHGWKLSEDKDGPFVVTVTAAAAFAGLWFGIL